MSALAPIGLYDPADDRDACGVGLVARTDGLGSREVVVLALEALHGVAHRGAIDADGKSGDGAGLRLDVPQAFFRDQVERTGHRPHPGPVGVGMIFLPRTDLSMLERARAVVETEIVGAGLGLYGWRQAPVEPRVLGQKAESARPEIEQVLFFDPHERPAADLEKLLYVVRRRMERAAIAAMIPSFYVASLSTETLVYKGMFQALHIEAFYPDLLDPLFVSRAAVFHQRYSTNTFPEWRLAQPFRMLAHNGEINTLSGNLAWMRSHEIGLASDAFGPLAADVRPIIQPGSSDSAALDQAFEALVRGGREAPLAKALLIPAAPECGTDPAARARNALYGYCSAVMEPWDGPAAIVACAGNWVIAGTDRSGLRPLRWATTRDGLLFAGSEAGLLQVDTSRIDRRGAVAPGGQIGVDLAAGALFLGDALPDRLAAARPYEAWTSSIVDLDPEIGRGPEPALFAPEDLRRRLRAAGVTSEDLEVVLAPMIVDGREAVGSMGDDAPLAVLSDRNRPLSHFFRQRFAQVTNPPIDPLREGRVMSLKTRFRNLGAVKAEDGPLPDILRLDGPVLTNRMLADLEARLGPASIRLDCTFGADAGPAEGRALRATIDAIVDAAEAAVDAAPASESVHFVLTDEAQGPARVAAPMILVVAALHRRLLDSGRRTRAAITARASDVFDPHGAAVLIGFGATCVNPYLALEAARHRLQAGAHPGLDPETAARRIKSALEGGLLKIMSKLGIGPISSYRGAGAFELLGLSRALAAEFFPGAPSRISGLGLAGLEAKALEFHVEAWGGPAELDVGGFYRVRARGEAHAIEAEVVRALQKAVRTEDRSAFDAYLAALSRPVTIQLRDLLDPQPLGAPVPLDAVESANTLRTRFLTPGMSLGALSPEAHGALNRAMNRIGAKSVSGEGGEDPARYARRPDGEDENSAVKQIASGRFGVTAEYLNQCKEIEIKIAQGAKPGEGGQLPGFKVTDFIAKMRHATPGVTLISPPPHHDIYSIEDLAQLIYDLKMVAPEARVCVKLVAAAGVGAVAAGVAKAKADVILISGHVGGTGASPQTSIKFAGAPWELGLSEAHQVLTLNGLRDQVTLRVDGGLRTGRDIVIAAMLGAEEFGIGTVSLIALGCLMVRQCHSNVCPVGVCTQDEALRAKFRGAADHVVTLMTFLAEDVRRRLAALGAQSLEDVIGRADLLAQVSRGAAHLDDLDLNPALVRVDPRWRVARRTARTDPGPVFDARILEDAAETFASGAKRDLSYTVRNTDRAIGARASAHIVRRWGAAGLPEGRLTVRLRGVAGQSLGAFGAPGLALRLDGEANDYVGKGLCGATIAITPPRPGPADAPNPDVILGNTCLYGATSGRLFAAGRAGERFAVRNSGAVAVIEGASANVCEYMTGGTVLVLGPVGENACAGMTGGEAFFYDPDGALADRLNPDTVHAGPLADDAAAERVRALLIAHHEATGSPFAASLLAGRASILGRFVHIEPQDIRAARIRTAAAA